MRASRAREGAASEILAVSQQIFGLLEVLPQGLERHSKRYNSFCIRTLCRFSCRTLRRIPERGVAMAVPIEVLPGRLETPNFGQKLAAKTT